MRIGIKGTGVNNAVKFIDFERVPGTHEPQVRIGTSEGFIFVKETAFMDMIIELFKEDPDYIARHAEVKHG